jgi:hypothetical protein
VFLSENNLDTSYMLNSYIKGVVNNSGVQD